MRIFDETCNQVKQGGKRRGAQMAILSVDHPDIGRFIVSKRNEGEFANFNISVAVLDDFIEAVENGSEFLFFDPQTDFTEPFEALEESAYFYDPDYQDNPASAFDDGEGAVVDENLWRDYADEIECDLDGERVSLREKWESEISVTPGEPLSLPAEFIWDLMIDGAWRNGEPGVFYVDEANRQQSFDTDIYSKYKMRATNPCAEQPLLSHEACNLGHVNLSVMVNSQAETWPEYVVNTSDPDPEEYARMVLDISTLESTVADGVRFLDNVVDQSDFPLDEITDRVTSLRKIGLGIMGLAQMLYQMGVRYGSDESLWICGAVMKLIDELATQASHELALERGSFEAWPESKYARPEDYPEWFEKRTHEKPTDHPQGYEIRNHKVTTIAPCGTTGMIANTSGGCEPVFNVAYFKNVGSDIQGDDFLVEFDDYFLRALEANDLPVEEVKREAESKMRANEFESVRDLESVPDEIAEIFTTTNEITAEEHTKMQRVLQRYVDSGISKTINMPNEATHDDVDTAYRLALDRDAIGAPIKGLTVYRDGSREEQVQTVRVDNKLDEDREALEERLIELYRSEEISDAAVATLAREHGFDLNEHMDGEVCPECQEGILHQTEGCAICPECGFSPCS
jgi:ribonucleoside-diphosphate reductase alpha chain